MLLRETAPFALLLLLLAGCPVANDDDSAADDDDTASDDDDSVGDDDDSTGDDDDSVSDDDDSVSDDDDSVGDDDDSTTSGWSAEEGSWEYGSVAWTDNGCNMDTSMLPPEWILTNTYYSASTWDLSTFDWMALWSGSTPNQACAMQWPSYDFICSDPTWGESLPGMNANISFAWQVDGTFVSETEADITVVVGMICTGSDCDVWASGQGLSSTTCSTTYSTTLTFSP